MKRNFAIDNVRGLVMIIMALDHVRDIFHETALTASPTDLSTTTPALFWTRVLTHLCAPTFVFLAGVSAAYTREKDDFFSRYLLKRGLVLILLDFTFIAFGLFWDLKFQTLLFNVLAAIGTGFIALSFLYKWPTKLLLLLAVLIIFGSPFLAAKLPGLLTPFVLPLGSKTLIIGYPPLPWFGIMLLGYGLKPYLNSKSTLQMGLGFLGAFSILRLLQVYDTPWQDVLSFFNLSKYPPSPVFILLTLGIMMLLLAALHGKRVGALSLFGQVPLFYFISHWYVMHGLLFAYLATLGYGLDSWEGGQNLGRPSAWKGLGLQGVYGAWMLTVICMYPLCRWYLQFKRRHPASLLAKYI